MGIIKKQSISGTIYSYVGVVLGFITAGLLYPLIFSTEEIGLLRILVSYSLLFAQFAGLGINTVTVKLFPYFRDYERKHNGYLGLALLVSAVGLVIAISAFLLLKSSILDTGKAGADLFFVQATVVSTNHIGPEGQETLNLETLSTEKKGQTGQTNLENVMAACES